MASRRAVRFRRISPLGSRGPAREVAARTRPAQAQRSRDARGAEIDGSLSRCVHPARHVAYIRVYRPYQADNAPQAIARLLAWAEQRGLADGQWLGYQWDDPEIVPLEKCRYDVGLEVPAGTTATTP